jgi:hypothetical protein
MQMMRILGDQRAAWRLRRAEHRFLRGLPRSSDEIAQSDWADSLTRPNEFWERSLRYFYTCLPKSVQEHRAYFEGGARGFGEKSFHVMWFLLFRDFQPESFLEIGVYRGQTLSLAALLARHFTLGTFVQGISPFSPSGGSFTGYRRDLDYYEDTRRNFAYFSLPEPALLKAFSTDEAAIQLIASRDWACVYIDGNHDYEVARQDWDLCAAHLRPGGLIVLDDSGLGTKYVRRLSPAAAIRDRRGSPRRSTAPASARSFSSAITGFSRRRLRERGFRRSSQAAPPRAEIL